MKDFDLKKYLAEGKLLKEEIMVDTTVMVDPNNTLMSNASDEEIDYIKANITSVPKMSVEDFIDIYDKYLDRFYDEADPLDLQIKSLQIHIDKGALTREEAIEALAMLQGQDVEEFEDEFSEEQMGSYGKFLEVVKSYEDEEILSDFLDSYPKGQDISKSEYERFTEKHLGLSDPEDYRGKNWKYIMSEGRLLKEVMDEEMEDYVSAMYDSDVDQEAEEGFQSDVWSKAEYAANAYNESSIFLELIDHLKSVGGKDIVEGNPDIELELLPNEDIRWRANVTHY